MFSRETAEYQRQEKERKERGIRDEDDLSDDDEPTKDLENKENLQDGTRVVSHYVPVYSSTYRRYRNHFPVQHYFPVPDNYDNRFPVPDYYPVPSWYNRWYMYHSDMMYY